MKLKAPFPYFGGKSVVAPIVWDALGDAAMYIEPFFGSGAVLLNRPNIGKNEIVNDTCGFVANVWRSLQFEPDEVARWCDWPINHADLHSRRAALMAAENKIIEGLLSDPEWCDAKMGAYWIYSASCWIGSGMTTKKGAGILGEIPKLSQIGGVHSKRPQLSHPLGVHSQIPTLNRGRGIHAQHSREASMDLMETAAHVQSPYKDGLWGWFRALSERLRYVRVVCGDWTRVCGGDWQADSGVCGIFFDPPYGHEGRASVYTHDSFDVASKVEQWCLQRGSNADHRIVCAGYEGEYKSLEAAGWTKSEWSTCGGYSNQRKGEKNINRRLERMWFSPNCLTIDSNRQMSLL